jgi:glutamine synthetase
MVGQLEMIRPRGVIDVAELKALAAADAIRTVIVGYPDVYGRLMGKRMTASFFLDNVLDRGVGISNYLLACDLSMCAVDGYDVASWSDGYGDMRLLPDEATLRVASWLDRTAVVICDACGPADRSPIDVAPRTILRRQIERFNAIGLRPIVASELELYICNDSYEEAARKRYLDLTPASATVAAYDVLQTASHEPLVSQIRDHLERSGIPVEGSIGEFGPGQQEINLRHADVLEMADRHILFKHAAKEIAAQLGRSITFMAAWNTQQMGSGLHLHVSVSDLRGTRQMFPGTEPLGPLRCSPVFRFVLGGWMAHLRELFPFYAPYPNSYKRFYPYTTPMHNIWNVDHRSAAFRVVGRDESLRIECRVPGADCNPYLAYAATLAAALDGIEQHIDPPPAVEGDPHAAAGLPPLPRTLVEALGALEASEWARRAFGESVVSHYLHFFRNEQRLHDEAVTDWDRARYFERA